MNPQDCLNLLTGPADHRAKMEAARSLATLVKESQVMDVLCKAAVTTTHRGLRDVLLDVLKANPAGACKRFSDIALQAKDPAKRKHALTNLRLLDCREAKQAVIGGLYDPVASVRKAAAMSAVGYGDRSVHMALEHYFESRRFEHVLSLIINGMNAILNKVKRPMGADSPAAKAPTRVSDILPDGRSR